MKLLLYCLFKKIKLKIQVIILLFSLIILFGFLRNVYFLIFTKLLESIGLHIIYVLT